MKLSKIKRRDKKIDDTDTSSKRNKEKEGFFKNTRILRDLEKK